MTTPLLQTSDIAKRFGPVVALRSVDLSVEPGQIHALLGANGAGKSTLVKILSGVFGADQGSVAVDGEPVRSRRPGDAMAAGIATVFQDPALVPDLTVAQNFRLTGADTDRIGQWLERFDLGDLDHDLQVGNVPLESLRLIDLARALSLEPRVLLLDEITAALPADKAEHVFDVMRSQREKGASVLFITHRLAEVRAVCDRATILREGRSVASLHPGEGDERVLIEAMLGDTAPSGSFETTVRSFDDRPTRLQVAGLRSGQRVRGIDLAIKEGEIVGIAALEGQGQERLFDLLAGDRRPDGGEIVVDGRSLQARSPYDAIAAGVVLVPSDRVTALLPSRPVRENLGIAFYNRVGRWFGLEPDEPAEVDAAIDRLSIDTRAERQVKQLSGGNQQKVVIGKWLAAGFRTLLLFDPTRGIDIQTKQQIYELLRELAAEGASILLYTSELSEIPKVCDRVLVMYGGRIVDAQPGPSATEASMLSAAHGLGSELVEAS